MLIPMALYANSFAIVIDDVTYEKTHQAVEKYRRAVEHDGLKTYLLKNKWSCPQEIRDSLVALYKRDPKLEGIVLIGDIPVPMIRNAQHMTTAFKMNEATFSIQESSVPSDRFYDDLHLEFKFIKQDADNKSLFYYKLSENSSQILKPSFYSARIRYPEAMGGDKYKAIANFLEKAANAKYQQGNQLDQVVSYNGASYNMDCLMVYMDEEKAYRENFPLAFNSGTGFKHWNFRMQRPMKYALLGELQRDDTDVFMFHEHGAPTEQLVGDNLTGHSDDDRWKIIKTYLYFHLKRAERAGKDVDSLRSVYIKKFALLPNFFDDYNNKDFWINDSIDDANMEIRTSDLRGRIFNPRFVMLDACYNGSFHEKDQIAGYYIFNPGNTLVVQGNTRNVLQDRWTIEMVGLLSHGCRVGQYNQLVATLEGHLVGDPTFRFAPIKANSLSVDIICKENDRKYWRKKLNDKYADVQCLALRKLYDMDKKKEQSSFFLDIFCKSKFKTVRMEALEILSHYADNNFKDAVKKGLFDSYERIARSCADYAGQICSPDLLPALIKVLFEDENRIRTQYALNSSLYLFPQSDVIEAIKTYLLSSNRIDRDDELKKAIKAISRQYKQKNEYDDAIFDDKSKENLRMQGIRFIRNNPRTPHIDKYLVFLADKSQPVALRLAMAEALGWFYYSIEKSKIIQRLSELVEVENNFELKSEMIQTIIRLKGE
jgi:hypothetical protein